MVLVCLPIANGIKAIYPYLIVHNTYYQMNKCIIRIEIWKCDLESTL